jgi:hypothetical protein
MSVCYSVGGAEAATGVMPQTSPLIARLGSLFFVTESESGTLSQRPAPCPVARDRPLERQRSLRLGGPPQFWLAQQFFSRGGRLEVIAPRGKRIPLRPSAVGMLGRPGWLPSASWKQRSRLSAAPPLRANMKQADLNPGSSLRGTVLENLEPTACRAGMSCRLPCTSHRL